jgi:hypothetical protein
VPHTHEVAYTFWKTNLSVTAHDATHLQRRFAIRRGSTLRNQRRDGVHDALPFMGMTGWIMVVAMLISVRP